MWWRFELGVFLVLLVHQLDELEAVPFKNGGNAFDIDRSYYDFNPSAFLKSNAYQEEKISTSTYLLGSDISPRRPYVPRYTSHAKLGGECRFKEFTMMGKIGGGGVSEVFLSLHNPTNQEFVLKRIPRGIVNDHPDMIRNEEQFQHDLLHPNIAPIYCSMRDGEGNVFFVLDHYPAGEVVVKEFVGKMDKVMPLIFDMLNLFYFLHDRRIVHADFKPANMIYDENTEKFRLIDFGFAEACSPTGNITLMRGTPRYMSPEIYLKQPFGMATDYWSLGVTAVQLATGKGLAHANQSMHKILDDDYEIPITGHEDLDFLIPRLLTYNPQKRWKLCYEQRHMILTRLSKPPSPSRASQNPVDILYRVIPSVLIICSIIIFI